MLSREVAKMLQVKLHSIENATGDGKAHAARAVALLQEIVNHPRFLPEVRATRFSYTVRMLDSGDLADTTDNETILQLLSGGKEVKSVPDGVIDLRVVLRKFNWFYRNTVGFATPPNPTIWTNRRFFASWLAEGDVLSVAAHWLHEWMHVAGFYHATDSGDPNDVPYAVGEIAVRIGQEIAGASPLKSFRGEAPGTGYLEAVSSEHACVAGVGVDPADLFDDTDSDEPDDDGA